jgi:hypothetical protein
MASTLIQRRQDNKLVERIASLEEQVQSLRTNQTLKQIWGNITIDGTGSQATIKIGNVITITDNGSNNGTILINDGTNNRVLIGYGAGLF